MKNKYAFYGTTIMNYKRITILCACYVLFCLTCNAQIDKFYKGDIVPYDSAVCMDINTYRIVRSSVSSCDKLLESRDALLVDYQAQVTNLKQGITDRDFKIVEQDQALVRKDSVLTQQGTDFRNMSTSTNKVLIDIEKKLPSKFVLRRLDFWMGLTIGVVTMILLK